MWHEIFEEAWFLLLGIIKAQVSIFLALTSGKVYRSVFYEVAFNFVSTNLKFGASNVYPPIVHLIERLELAV